jgi:hypothetical protein
VGNLLSNHSTEHPSGELSKLLSLLGPTVLLTMWTGESLLKSWYGVTGSGYKYGHERIPDNFFKRAVDYSLTDVNLDVIGWFEDYPEL